MYKTVLADDKHKKSAQAFRDLDIREWEFIESLLNCV